MLEVQKLDFFLSISCSADGHKTSNDRLAALTEKEEQNINWPFYWKAAWLRFHSCLWIIFFTQAVLIKPSHSSIYFITFTSWVEVRFLEGPNYGHSTPKWRKVGKESRRIISARFEPATSWIKIKKGGGVILQDYSTIRNNHSDLWVKSSQTLLTNTSTLSMFIMLMDSY